MIPYFEKKKKEKNYHILTTTHFQASALFLSNLLFYAYIIYLGSHYIYIFVPNYVFNFPYNTSHTIELLLSLKNFLSYKYRITTLLRVGVKTRCFL